jgi:aryl-alcohol dehydrogenase-like predicted oxidoreductase
MGRTGLQVAPLCLGGNTFGWTTDQAKSEEVLDAYVAGGGNFIDTADVYSLWVPGNTGGDSERVLGKWLKARGNRQHVIIATKVGSKMGDRPNESGLSRQHIMAGVEASLRNLQTDYIDLYQSHRDDLNTPVEETLRAYDDLIAQGKVRYIGASNFAAWRLTRNLWASDRYNYARYETLQPRYNLYSREDYERELEPLCLDQQIGVISYSSLASGFFSGKYCQGQPLPNTPRAKGVEKTYMNERGFKILAEVERVAEGYKATSSQVALAWLLARPGLTAPIVSGTSVEQVQQLLGAAELKLAPDALAALDKVSDWRVRG